MRGSTVGPAVIYYVLYDYLDLSECASLSLNRFNIYILGNLHFQIRREHLIGACVRKSVSTTIPPAFCRYSEALSWLPNTHTSTPPCPSPLPVPSPQESQRGRREWRVPLDMNDTNDENATSMVRTVKMVSTKRTKRTKQMTSTDRGTQDNEDSVYESRP